MKKKKMFNKAFSAFLIFMMVFAMLAPTSVFANTEKTPFKSQGPSESTLALKAAIAEQLSLTNNGPTLHKDLQGLTGDEEVAVIVHLSEKPVALEKGIRELAGKSFSKSEASAVKAKVISQQASVKKEMNNKMISYKEIFSYDTVLNGFAANVKASDLVKLLNVNGVTLVEPDTTVYAMEDSSSLEPVENDTTVDAAMNTSISFLGIEKLWEEGIEGQGIKVAVLDTGIDADHPEFAGIYKGGKNFIPNSAVYTRTRADDDASETSPVERPAGTPEFNERGSAFYTSHGTHVAGTIAAIGANEYGIKGIAPKVDLYAYRVLGAYGSGSNSGIVKAIDTAVIEGMDVINLSLGGGSNTETDAGSFAINNAMMAGTIGVLATGNDGPNRGTISPPATSRLGIAVGNTTNPETMYNGEINVTVGDYNLTKQLQLMGSTFGKDLATQLQGEFDLVAVPGNGEAKDYQGIDVDGKVALISRGSIAFVDKIAYAKENGAVAAIIHNFAGGTNAPNASGTFLGDSFAFIPTYDMSQTDGDAIRAALNGGEGKVSFGNFDSAKTLGDDVNDSSSRGPSTPNFDIKPDVSAPGTNIMSTIPMYKADFPDVVYNEAFDRKTGTSMATPHIAGIAALVKQANPDWNAFDVKVALSNTAKILDKTKYDVFAQGAGRVDAYAAAHPSVLAYAVDTAVQNASGTIVENLKGTVTFGPQSLEEDISVTKEILVKDIQGIGGEYKVTVDVTKEFSDATVTVDKPTFTLDGEELLTVTLTASKNAAAKAGDEILGYIHITPADETKTETSLSVDKTELNMKTGDKLQLNVKETTTSVENEYTEISLPFAADFGGEAATEIRNMSINETDLSFDGDGVQDKADLTFTLTGAVGLHFVEVWDIMNPDGGEYGDGYIGYLHAANSLGAGSWKLTVNGIYQPWSEEPVTIIPDGLYTFDFNAYDDNIFDYVGPIVVKTTDPEITGAVTEGVVTGQVTDKYIDYNEELSLYGLEYDLNEKLNASYIATVNGVETAAVDFDLDQDGSFSFPVTAETESVKVIIKDAAGNIGEQVIEGVVLPTEPVKPEAPATPEEGTTPEEPATPEEGTTPEEPATPEEPVVPEDPADSGLNSAKTVSIASLESNEIPKLTLVSPYENSVPASEPVQSNNNITDGPPSYGTFESDTVKDVTKDATYTVADPKVATVTDGLVTAKAAGKTTITVKYGGNEKTVNVTVTNPPTDPGNPGNGGGGGNPGTSNPGTGNPGPVKPTPPVTPTPSPIIFTDVPAKHWAADYIQKAALLGFMKGYPDGSFRPEQSLTRAQATSLIVRALKLETQEAAPFEDIANFAAETKSEIAAGYKYGIIKGDNGKFKPSEKVTRAQLALMIERAYAFKTGKKYTATKIAPFSDIAAYDEETINAISMLYELQVVNGSDGKFNPSHPTTRAQAAKIFTNFMGGLK
ncbi:S8 family serine peptidase [Psychrobacillus sp. INOP01]|uniref:S8 family serine peptidase n=1 Tax=Psychrobacillus sp. INOP01 TaxID=2829187 RepID=UPI001BA840B9|nr:S8 family serine peptidase [Psychrobacillus sp. INOP01]QUG40575.1 S8 family serine peptidase [Psychrobacillus sp. INOP01]